MATFIEVQGPGDLRTFLKVSAIERLELPPGLKPNDLAPPDNPIKIFCRDGSVADSFGFTATHLLFAMLSQNGPCVFVDPTDGADG